MVLLATTALEITVIQAGDKQLVAFAVATDERAHNVRLLRSLGTSAIKTDETIAQLSHVFGLDDLITERNNL